MSFRHSPRRPEEVWVLVADRTRARIFSYDAGQPKSLTEVADMVHPESAQHERDVVSDKPSSFIGSGHTRHRGVEQTDFHHRTATEFAHQIEAALEQGRAQNRFGRLVIAAPALMLGVLREELHAPLRQLVAAELTKDYTHLNTKEVLSRLNEEGVLQDRPELTAGK
jgi:protein required for attachment to host cells